MRAFFYHNKRGDFFALGLVLITGLMIGVVIYMYFMNQAGILGLLVSPVEVMKVGDDLDVFEMLEYGLIGDAFSETSGDFKDFKKSFLKKVNGNSFMMDFLFDGLVLEGVDSEGIAKLVRMNFLESYLYSITHEGGKISITRKTIGKSFVLEAKKTDKIHFPVRFNFEFSGKYLVDEDGNIVKV